MDRDKLIIYMVFVFSQGIGGDRSMEVQNTKPNNECFMPNDFNGNCINITRCPTHYPLENQIQNSSLSIYLRNSMCVNEGNSTYYPKVCCPLEDEPTINTESSQKKTTPNNDSTVLEIYKINSPIKLPSQTTCGQKIIFHQRSKKYTLSKLIGGSITELGDWPWMAALGCQHRIIPTSEYKWICGGSLISDSYVLTAAHCIVGLRMYRLAVVRLADSNLFPKMYVGAKSIEVEILSVIRHEEYNIQEVTNDIALLKLNNSIGFNQYIQPICLPILPHHRTNTFVESDLFVTGWGSTRFAGPRATSLMKVGVRTINNSECKRAFAKKNFVIDDRMLCAGSSSTGSYKDACQGDSGGPLMWPNGNQYYLVGIVSFGYKCGEPGYPGVYTRVTSFVKWIVDNMN